MKFNKEYHSYINDKGEAYTSATSFIKSFCKPFERMKRAKAFAKKHNRTVEDVLAEWDKAGKDAIDKGTAYHEMKERELLSKLEVEIEGEKHVIYPSQWEGDCKVSSTCTLEVGVHPEAVLWSDKYKVAGQADKVEITKGGKINIIDYKTSKEIKMKGYEKWDGTHQMMSFPLQNLHDCNYFQYALQLNLYAFMIKQHNRNLKIGDLIIEQIKGEFDEQGNFNIEQITQYKVPDLQKEIKIALEYWKNKQL